MTCTTLFFIKLFVIAAMFIVVSIFIAYKYKYKRDENASTGFMIFGIIIALVGVVLLISEAPTSMQAMYYNDLIAQKESLTELFKNADNEASKNAYANERERIIEKIKHEEKYMTYKDWIAVDKDK